MLEIEGKILEIDITSVVQKLEDRGAKKVFDGELDVIFFDFPDGRLQSEGKRLRLRRMGDKAEFTFKKKISRDEVKIEDEYEVMTSDFEEMRTILKNLGMNEVRRYQKHRISYALGVVKFEIDQLIGGIPPYLEIEARSLEEVQQWAECLGFKKEQILSWSGSDVLRYYGILSS